MLCFSSYVKATEDISSRDITYSSVSISEPDPDLEGLAGRVAELEELLQGKEAIVGALHAEIDHLRAEASSPNSSQSRSSSIHGKDIISLYHIKVSHVFGENFQCKERRKIKAATLNYFFLLIYLTNFLFSILFW